MKITPGSEVGPISLGTEGAWRVVAPGVAPKHAYLFYDGQRLFLQSLNSGTPAMVDGKAIPDEWTELSAPCEIALGDARLSFAAVGDEPMDSARNVPVPAPSTTGPDAPSTGERPFAPGAFSQREDSEVTRMEEIVGSGRGPGAPTPGVPGDEEPEIATRVHSPLFPGGPGALPVGMLPRDDAAGPPSSTGPLPAAGRPVSVVGQTPPVLSPPGAVLGPGGPQSHMPVTPPGSFSPFKDPPPGDAPVGQMEITDAKPKGWWGRQPFPRKIIFMIAPLLIMLGVVMKVPALKSKLLPGLGKKPTPAATTSAPASSTDTPPPGAGEGGAAAAEGTGTGEDTDTGEDTGTGTGSAVAATSAAATPPPPPPPRWGRPAKVTKSMERKATDALAAGEFHVAADLYEKLAEKNPENPVYQEAAEIVRAKAGPRPPE